jgi:hypothetical protein
MAGPDWRSLRGVDRGRLSQARLSAHYAAQWLARAARAYVPPKADDSHTNLSWDDTLGAFTTHPLTDGLRLGLRIADLALVIAARNDDASAQLLALDGLTEADICAWLGPHMGAKGLDAHALDAPSPYEMPAFAVAGGARYAADGQALNELAAWYGNAHGVLNEARQVLLDRQLRAPPVRCWPHHFDLDSLIYFEPANLGNVRTMGVGFSPGDEYYDEPYFYVSLYPAPEPASLPPLPAIGHWHTREFTAAVATASRLLAEGDQSAETATFLRTATDIAVRQLS